MCLSCVFLVLGKSEKKEAEREENKGIEGTFHHGGLSDRGGLCFGSGIAAIFRIFPYIDRILYRIVIFLFLSFMRADRTHLRRF